MAMEQNRQVLYVYHCQACGHRGEERLAGDAHDGEESKCHECGSAVSLAWDGGETLEQRPTDRQ